MLMVLFSILSLYITALAYANGITNVHTTVTASFLCVKKQTIKEQKQKSFIKNLVIFSRN